jgi:hypothetical protein
MDKIEFFIIIFFFSRCQNIMSQNMLLFSELADGTCQIQSELILSKEKALQIIELIKEITAAAEKPEVVGVSQINLGPVATSLAQPFPSAKSPSSSKGDKGRNHSCAGCKQFKNKKDMQEECKRLGKTFASSDSRKDLCDKLSGTPSINTKPFSPSFQIAKPPILAPASMGSQIPNFQLNTSTQSGVPHMPLKVPQIPPLGTQLPNSQPAFGFQQSAPLGLNSRMQIPPPIPGSKTLPIGIPKIPVPAPQEPEQTTEQE